MLCLCLIVAIASVAGRAYVQDPFAFLQQPAQVPDLLLRTRDNPFTYAFALAPGVCINVQNGFPEYQNNNPECDTVRGMGCACAQGSPGHRQACMGTAARGPMRMHGDTSLHPPPGYWLVASERQRRKCQRRSTVVHAGTRFLPSVILLFLQRLHVYHPRLRRRYNGNCR